MRVFHVTTDAGLSGAGIAAVRLHQGLLEAGVDSTVLSTSDCRPGIASTKVVTFGNSFGENLWRRWRHFQIQRMRQRHQPRPSNFYPLTDDLSCYGKALLEACRGADILNFHCVINLLDFPFVLPRLNPEVPLVWTLHDLSPGTGGCIHPMECKAFHSKCGCCPHLDSEKNEDLSTEIWNRKAKALGQLRARLFLVSPSDWLANQVQASSLLSRFPVQTIPNSLDITRFRPRESFAEKQHLDLNPTAPTVLFIASRLNSPLKGLRYLLEAIPLIRTAFPNVQFVSVGHVDDTANWPSSIKHLGAVSDEEKMARIYSAADVLATPSVADNLPNVILESMACGVPAVGFPVGGIPEAIQQGETGFVAEEISARSLAAAVCRLLQAVTCNRENWERQCRQRAERNFALSIQAARYQSLYQSLLWK